mgnify:FL=1|jgi:hypothetical protein
MKKNIFLIAGIALTAMFSGCADENLDNTVKNPVKSGEEIMFGSKLSGDADVIESKPGTRTVYGDRTTTGVPVYWEADGSDEIAIFCNQASQPASHLVNYKITPDETKHEIAASVAKVNPSEAGLQWGDLDTEHRFYAFYPASAVEGSAEEDQTGKITANIPVTQQVQEWRIVNEGANGAIDGKKTYFGLPNMDYAYMYAYNAVTPSQVDKSKSIDLQFHNLVTVLDITVQGPSSGTATITNINVDAIDGTTPILTGDFTCNIRNASTGEGAVATCEPVGDFNEERGRISIPCYDKKTGQFIQLGPNELLNVKAYIIPQDKNTVTKRTLRVTVSLLNGAPCRKTLQTADVTPHKINRVILPPLTIGGTNYWMSSLDPNIYVSELSLPGSKMSYLTSANRANIVYQNATIEEQLMDGVRAFIFHTQRMSNGELRISVNGSALSTTLKEALSEIATFLKDAESLGKKQETAFVLVTYSGGSGSEQDWMTALQNTVNECAGDYDTYRIFDKEMTPDVTLGDVAGQIILKANYNSDAMISGAGTAPLMYTKWEVPYVEGGLPMTWGNPNSAANLWWLYQEVTSVLDTDKNENNDYTAEATKAEKIANIKAIFQKSVDAYNNDTSHKTWFMNDLGGYYCWETREWAAFIPYWQEHTDTKALATDMNSLGVSELQNRTENAGLGLVYMNFADKQEDSGALYKSDWLIQTIIDNNFKFALRKKGSSTTPSSKYNATYSNGGNAVGWDK